MADFPTSFIVPNSSSRAFAREEFRSGGVGVKAMFLKNTYTPNAAHLTVEDLEAGTNESFDAVGGAPQGGTSLTYAISQIGNEWRFAPASKDLSSTTLLDFKHVAIFTDLVTPNDRLIVIHTVTEASGNNLLFPAGLNLILPASGLMTIAPLSASLG